MGCIDTGTCMQVVSSAWMASTETSLHAWQHMPLRSIEPGAPHVAVFAVLPCYGHNDQRLGSDTESWCLRVMKDTSSGWCKSSSMLALLAVGSIAGRLLRHSVVDVMGPTRGFPADEAACKCFIVESRSPFRLMAFSGFLMSLGIYRCGLRLGQV